jgi:DNA topoisomerase-3
MHSLRCLQDSRQIHHAAQHPVELDRAQAAAVEARIILDLKVGAAFTRMQTQILQTRFGQLAEGKNVVSYGESSSHLMNGLPSLKKYFIKKGPCQFPTLGFVVQKWNIVKSFVSEPFWYIYLSLIRNSEEETVFTWRRGHLFDFAAAVAIYDNVLSNPLARVTKVTNKGTKKW